MANLTRYNERKPDLFRRMERDLDDVFRSWFGASPWGALSNAQPSKDVFGSCELEETDTEYVLKMDVPGMSEKDINVCFQNDALTISGERSEEKTDAKGQTRYTERSYGSFERTLAMPPGIKADEVRARYRNGVMEVHLPKAQKSPSRNIKVETGP